MVMVAMGVVVMVMVVVKGRLSGLVECERGRRREEGGIGGIAKIQESVWCWPITCRANRLRPRISSGYSNERTRSES